MAKLLKIENTDVRVAEAAKADQVKDITSTKGTARIVNEADGGVIKFENNDGTWSGIAVNDGGASGIAAQIYAVEKSDSKKGVKINVEKDKITYIKNKETSERKDTDEIAVKGDIPTKYVKEASVNTEKTKLTLKDNNNNTIDFEPSTEVYATKTWVNGQKGIADGIASLDSDKKVPMSQIPDAIIGNLILGGTVEKGSDEKIIAYPTASLKEKLGDNENIIQLINESSDFPSEHKYGFKTLEKVYFICRNNFDVTVEGSTTEFVVGDWLIGAGTYWDKIENVDAVKSVNGQVGIVTLDGKNLNVDESATEKKTIKDVLDNKISLLGNEAVSSDPYHFPYHAAFTASDDNIKITAYTITLDNNKTLKTFDFYLPSATTTAAGLLSVSDKTKYDGYETTIAGKQDTSTLETDVAAKGFTKNEGTITGIKMNGASKGTSGEVDLGTVITEHQSLADYSTTAQMNDAISKYHDSTKLDKYEGTLTDGKKYLIFTEKDGDNWKTKVIEYSFE